MQRDDDDRPSDAPMPIGARIREYVVKDTIAAGGFGVVYRVEHAETGAPAALKVLHAELASTQEPVLRFEREVDVIRRLHHPNVVEIYDSGRLDDGRPYFVMELLEGSDLEAYVRSRRRLPPAEILSILEPLCAALATAHERGIIHRDLKASNVFITTKGDAGADRGSPSPSPHALADRRVVLLDFGVAKLIDEQGPGLTAPSHVVGTPSCMAPEQITGQPTDARTDVYALGALTYYMLTGELPFHDASVLMIQYMHLNTMPLKPSSIAPVGPAFDQVVLRAMSKHPTARQSSALELFAEVRAAVEGHDDEVAEKYERRMVAIHLEVQAESGALEDDNLDDDLFRDMEASLPFASRILVQKGFMLAMMTGNTRLLVKELPSEPDKEALARRDAVRTALALERQLASRPTFDDRVQISMCLHVGQVLVAGGKLVDGELLQLSSWVQAAPSGGVVGSLPVLAGLGFTTQPVTGTETYLRVLDRPGA
jgi:serine/threonine-protein kinase